MTDGDLEADWAWADQFLPHQADIAQQALRVNVASIHDDMRRNTDLILRSAVPLRAGRELRISARVRRHAYLASMSHAPGLAYREQITIRDRRPAAAQTEMDKLRLGEGDIFVYGFESEQGSGKLFPWVVIDLDQIRAFDAAGGYSRTERNKGPGGSWLRVFNLNDLPREAVIASDGIIIEQDRASGWLSCRNPTWEYARTSPPGRNRVGMCAGRYAHATGPFQRQCLCCGFE